VVGRSFLYGLAATHQSEIKEPVDPSMGSFETLDVWCFAVGTLRERRPQEIEGSVFLGGTPYSTRYTHAAVCAAYVVAQLVYQYLSDYCAAIYWLSLFYSHQ
jgi:hypothetical protein